MSSINPTGTLSLVDFPNDDAATKLLYLILNRSGKAWSEEAQPIRGIGEHRTPPRESMAKAQFAVIFGERFIKAMAA